ncbi:2OG-Fe dioxygenase family protein [Salinarimonas ramus]|uniref:Uncharacterized protein n=1 Tax=Salinarimonas ramus TaxID=690164 RepID=A0A917Q8N6_9HYPH|nr:2OG-Fe dioxygenase family protein [Salinarimonas ramus]GGK32461.1 hypothetical protein GCM10011322_18980 [Salinarimonas ramus]
MQDFHQAGYCHYDLSPALDMLNYRDAWVELKNAFNDLPRDPYASQGVLRQRRYGCGFYKAYLNELDWMKSSLGSEVIYDQGEYNPEHRNQARRFPSIPREILRNPVLKLLIDNDFHRTHFAREFDSLYRVGVHLVRLVVDPQHPVATVSPDCLHRDGEPYTFAHLVHRESVVGGENYIAAADAAGRDPETLSQEEILAKFVLERELESFGVDDLRVSHALADVRLAPSATRGVRDIVLVDFTPVATVLGQH